MSNYIRANFCITKSLQASQLYSLLQELEQLNCKYNFWKIGIVSVYLEADELSLYVKEKSLDKEVDSAKLKQLAQWLELPGHITIEFGWHINDTLYSARLLQIWHHKNQPRCLSFDIEENAFFHEKQVEYLPHNNDLVYRCFKQIIVKIIGLLQPDIGIIDYEADIMCDSLKERSGLASWGNYYTESILAQWENTDLYELEKIVDEFITIEGSGTLTFLHPLAVNQAWGDRHEKIDILLRRNPIINQ